MSIKKKKTGIRKYALHKLTIDYYCFCEKQCKISLNTGESTKGTVFSLIDTLCVFQFDSRTSSEIKLQ